MSMLGVNDDNIRYAVVGDMSIVDVPVEYGDEPIGLKVARPQVFDILHRLTHEMVTSHQGDYYYDVVWMERHVPATVPQGQRYRFYYGARPMGTGIGEDADLVVDYNDFAWEVTITNKERRKGAGYRHYLSVRVVKAPGRRTIKVVPGG